MYSTNHKANKREFLYPLKPVLKMYYYYFHTNKPMLELIQLN